MRSICFCVIAFAVSVSTQRLILTPPNVQDPIKRVEYSHGQGGEKRVHKLYAEIRSTTDQRTSFPTSGEIERWYQAIRADGDERGHLVASQFKGPIEWYNLSPQHKAVNRNVKIRHILVDWFNTEKEVREFLDASNNRHVSWTVDMTFDGDSNRPENYRLQVKFFENNSEVLHKSIDTTLPNSRANDFAILRPE